jgi:hypothetical protein
MSTPSTRIPLEAPATPAGVKPSVRGPKDYARGQEFVTVHGYNTGAYRVLSPESWEIVDVEREYGPEEYARMELNPIVAKIKEIIITGATADEPQFSPGTSEEEAGEDWAWYEEIYQFCLDIVGGLERPIKETYQEHLRNCLPFGHSIAETEWEQRVMPKAKKRKAGTAQEGPEKPSGRKKFSAAELFADAPKTRFMPVALHVKPFGTALFAVDDFNNELGIIPAWATGRAGLDYNEIIDREKFTVVTWKKKNGDSRGESAYRPIVIWENFLRHVPAEYMRFLLTEAVDIAIGELPPDAQPYQYDRAPDGSIQYELDPVSGQPNYDAPKMMTAAESMEAQVGGLRNGSGAVVPNEADIRPYRSYERKGDVFPLAINTARKLMEGAILLQDLAQSEGEHQARAAAQELGNLLALLWFNTKWSLAVMTLFDLCAPAVRQNYGDWALRFMPRLALGDYMPRDWVAEFQAMADAYFKGFVDDDQRAPLMADYNMPKPGKSRQQKQEEMAAQMPTGPQPDGGADKNGSPQTPNPNRPDKAPANKGRNRGNGTEKKDAVLSGTTRGPLDGVGRRTGQYVRYSQPT